MLFHLTTDDHIGIINEQGPAEAHSEGTTFASEQHFHELAKEWADEAIGCDLESPARSRSGGSVHRSQHRDCTDLASHSAVNRSRSYDCATPFKSETAAAALSRRFESGTGLHFAVPAGRRHPERDPKPNRVAGPYGAWVHLAHPVQAKSERAF